MDKVDKHKRPLAWRRNTTIGMAIAFIVVITLSVTSSMGTLLIANNLFDYPVMLPISGLPTYAVWLLSVAVGAFSTLLTLWMWRKSDDVFDVIVFRRFAKGRKIRDTITAISLILIIASIPIIAWLVSLGNYFGLDVSRIEILLRSVFLYLDAHAGGTVSFTISVISVVAFFILIQQLRDIQGSVSSFSEMVERIQRLVRECSHDSPMHVISYTPALGFLALPRSYRDRLFGLMTKTDVDGQSEVRLIVLAEDQLRTWHDEFSGRSTRLGKISAADVAEVQTTSMEIRSRQRACKSEKSYGEVDRDSLPGYYCFFNERRAIVVTPFFLPIAGQDPAQRETLPAPNMVGYETSDRTTLDYLKQQFGYLEQFARWT